MERKNGGDEIRVSSEQLRSETPVVAGSLSRIQAYRPPEHKTTLGAVRLTRGPVPELSLHDEINAAAERVLIHGIKQQARSALNVATIAISDVIREARTRGTLDLTALNSCIDGLVDSILECPNVLLWHIRADENPRHFPHRSVGCAVYSIAFGRQLGYGHEMLKQIAIGGLLMDIGKAAIPVPLLAKPTELNSAERSFVERHVDRGFDMVKVIGGISSIVLEMILGHHERLDGSGYPQGLLGTRIPLLGRIAAIVDTFDALTSDRYYASAMSGHAALRYLSDERGTKFDSALVDKFVSAVGIYPTGTWVEMLDGSTGIVCAQNPERPLQPYIAMMLDEFDAPLEHAIISEPQRALEIARVLEPGTHLKDAEMMEIMLEGAPQSQIYATA
jgi:HD-GYP domain-containing protein (c-di-GMP phosphodiesterase class II)